MSNNSEGRGQAVSFQRLNITDFMTIGIFFVINTIVGIVVSFVGVTPVTFVMIAPLQALVLGIPTMLFYSRVKKPGMLLIMAVIGGLFNMLMALGPYSLVFGVLLSLIAETLLWAGKYKSARNSIIAYAFTALATAAVYAPLFFATKAYIANNIAERYSSTMTQGVTEIGAHSYVFAIIIVATFVAGLAGGFLGQKVFNKHFRRAGIV